MFFHLGIFVDRVLEWIIMRCSFFLKSRSLWSLHGVIVGYSGVIVLGLGYSVGPLNFMVF